MKAKLQWGLTHQSEESLTLKSWRWRGPRFNGASLIRVRKERTHFRFSAAHDSLQWGLTHQSEESRGRLPLDVWFWDASMGPHSSE